jgi:hypothetical protein
MRLFTSFILVFSFFLFLSCENDSTGTLNKDEKDEMSDENIIPDDHAENEIEETVDEDETDILTDDAEEIETIDEDELIEVPDEEEVVEEMTEEKFMEKVEGRYAHYDVVAYYTDMGMMGIFKNLIISYGFTTFEKEGDKLKITDRFCHSEQITNQNFTAVVPDELTQAIIPDSTYMDINQDDEGNFYLWRPRTPTLLGIEYEDPYNTPLPKSIKPDDPRLVDADFDGNPGVTVFIDMFNKTEEIYVARREIFAFEAYLQEDGKIEGVVHDDSEQLVIDATSFLLKSDDEWVQYRGENGEDYSLSPIILVPIDDSYDCEKLMENRDDIFPPNPPVWED